jgi:hypothetical protein
MFEIIKLFFGICFFRKSPEDIPHSFWLFQLALASYAVIGFLVLFLAKDFLSTLLQLGVEVLLVLFFTWGMLQFYGKPARYYQTATALLGTDAVISFCALPVMSALSAQMWPNVAIILLLLMMLWHLVVTGHILSHAFSRSFWLGLILAFCYIVISYRVIDFLFPVPEIMV